MKKTKVFIILFAIILLGLISLGFTIGTISMAEEEDVFDDIGKTTKIDDNLASDKKIGYLYNEKTIDGISELWYAIKFLNEKNYVSGYTNTIFAPGDEFTRDQWVAILWRMAGRPYEGTPYYYDIFPDVEYDLIYENGEFKGHKKYYTIPAVWAAKFYIMDGYVHTGEFGIGDGITREDAVVAAYNYYRYKTDEKMMQENVQTDMSYSDSGKIASYAYDSIRWAIARGIIVDSTNKFKPKDVISRGESMILYYRVIELLGEV